MVKRIGLVVHGGKDIAGDVAAQVRNWAATHVIPCVDIDVWGELGSARLSAHEEAERAGRPDLVVTVGGDGTFLRGVRVAAAVDAAVLGVDIGRVGFLTEVSVSDLVTALDAVLADTALIDARSMLTLRASRTLEIPDGMEALLRYGRGPAMPSPAVRPSRPEDVGWGVALDVVALNDVVFEKLARDRQASLAVYVDGREFASYSADALIVASATGSTAYSFAAGGPIVSPSLDALIFTPVAAHMVFNRSLVLSMQQFIGIAVLEHSGQVAVSIDGQLRGVLDPGDWLLVYGARNRARLVRLREPDFLGRVRDRFGLADAVAATADGAGSPAEHIDAPLPADLADPGPAPKTGHP